MTQALNITTVEVNKKQCSTTRVVQNDFDGTLEPNQVLLKIDCFALTANNISYCVAGEMLGYWGFFPTTDGYGRVPMMGYANVAASNNPNVTVGQRVFGFYPMSDYLLIEAGKVSASGFTDVSAHRAKYPPFYAQYSLTTANPFHEAKRENYDMLLRGLYTTSWLVEDFMFANDTFGARDYLITSASSKTSIALAHVVQARGKSKTIGITSEANYEFCLQLGCYDTVITYNNITQLDPSIASVVVDMAGNNTVLRELHEHFNSNIKYSCKVGGTHTGAAIKDNHDMPGARPEFFFAPGQAQRRNQEWGKGEVEKRVAHSLAQFQDFAHSWLEIKTANGAKEIEQSFLKVLAGGVSPDDGIILSM